jgi:hypothetical protein
MGRPLDGGFELGFCAHTDQMFVMLPATSCIRCNLRGGVRYRTQGFRGDFCHLRSVSRRIP